MLLTGLGNRPHPPPHSLQTLKAEPKVPAFTGGPLVVSRPLSALLGRAFQLLLITQATLVSLPQLSEGQKEPALASASHHSEDPAVLSLASVGEALVLPSHVLADPCSGGALRVSGW